MAAWTLTASGETGVVRADHRGETIVYRTFQLNARQSLSASDIILLCQIPNGAWLLDGTISGTVGGDGTVFKVGTSVSDCALFALATFSATAQMKRADALNLPFKVSISDDAIPQSAWLFATRISGTSTATASLQFVIRYFVGGLP